MAKIRCDFFAESLMLETAMTVLLPEEATEPPPVLYLLHGLSDNHAGWTRFTSIERYVYDYGFAVVMPDVHRSFYADQVRGPKFWTFLSEELPGTVDRLFRVSTRRADTFVAGLSMGGYGALKWALRQPSRFAAAASLSGALDIASVQEKDDRPHMVETMRNVFDDRTLRGSDDDLLHLLDGVQDPPRLMLRCGTEDHTLEYNRTFAAACQENGIALDAGFGPGAHDWPYWDDKIQEVLAFFKAA